MSRTGIGPRGRTIGAVAGAAACLSAAIGLQIVRDRVYAAGTRDIQRVLYVRSGEAVKRLALDFDALWSDVYWIRAIQHYGGDRMAGGREQRYELLFPLLDLTTTLDPYFTIAYRFGAIFLSERYPSGPGRPDWAIALLQKGIVAQPDKWQYYHDIAFVHYWHMRDLEAAARWFQRAAERPGSPNWLRPLVASMLSAGSNRAAARFLWQQMLSSEEVWMRRNAERSLLQLDALELAGQLEALARRFPPPPGGTYSWDRLIRQRILRGIPEDPTGTPFEIDPDTGAVRVAANSDLFPMPAHLQP
jgi:hypothetical protein